MNFPHFLTNTTLHTIDEHKIKFFGWKLYWIIRKVNPFSILAKMENDFRLVYKYFIVIDRIQ